MTVKTVAMLTAGGLAPCLSSAVGGLIERYSEVAPDVRIMAYRNGYAGLLTGDSVEVTDEVRAKAHLLHGSAAARSATAGSSSPTSRTASSAAWSRRARTPCTSRPSS